MNQTDRVFADSPGVPSALVERHTRIDYMVPVALLDDPLKPMRQDIDDAGLVELMDDIRRNGLLQNIGAVPTLNRERVEITEPSIHKIQDHIASGGRFRVVWGHRRTIAMRGIFMAEARCKVICDLDGNEQGLMHTENARQEAVSDMDLAYMYSDWMKEEGITETALCKRAGKSPDFIYARVELLNGYKEVADALHARKIKFGVARALNRADEPEYMLMWLQMAIDQGATSKLVNAWISERKAHKDMTPSGAPPPIAGITVTMPMQQRIECLICGDTQSYNLRTVMMCQAHIDRVKAAREAADAAEVQPDDAEVMP